MGRLIVGLLFFIGTLNALSLDEVIERALDEKPSLASIEARIQAGRSAVEASDQFSNPQISYIQNTLDKAQAMHQKTLTLQQNLPYYGKRAHRKKAALAQEGVLIESLVKAKAALVYAIKEQAYTLWELEKVYALTCDYEVLTQHTIDLYTSYSSISEGYHLGIMSATLKLSDLRIQKKILHAKITAAYAKLSYFAAQEVNSLEMEIGIGIMSEMTDAASRLQNNPDLALKEQESRREQANVELAELNSYPDINLVAGYAYRDNFDNYASFGVGISLPLYGSEAYKEQEARKSALAAQHAKEDMRGAVGAEFQSAYALMRSAFETYHVINDEMLPQIEHMFALSSSSVSAGGDLFKYIDILLQKLRLEQKSINAIADYKRAEAKISELTGEIK
ncbi:MAG: TolC family protein [Campylobacterales bacterium]|nr:TolC family protein [Campylobacterales bacterium]